MNPNRQAFIAGLFVITGIALLFTGFIFFGGRSFFTPKATFVTFFNESVKGLAVGSSVRFKGVPVGRVTNIRIQMSGDTTITGIPVFYEIDRRRLARDLGVIEDIQSDEVYHVSLQNGLSAALEAESLVTGILAISLDFRPAMSRQTVEGIRLDLFEIPAAPSALANFQDRVSMIVAQFSEIDFLELAESTTTLVKTIDARIQEIDTAAISREALTLLEDIRQLLDEAEIAGVASDLRQLIAEFDDLGENLNGEMARLGPELAQLVKKFGIAIDSLEDLVGNANQIIDPDSLIYRNSKRTLRELEVTLRSIRQLTEYLESNPNAIFSGRSE